MLKWTVRSSVFAENFTSKLMAKFRKSQAENLRADSNNTYKCEERNGKKAL